MLCKLVVCCKKLYNISCLNFDRLSDHMQLQGSRPRGRPKKTWKEVVHEDCQARKLNKEDAMDRCKWRKVIKEAR